MQTILVNFLFAIRLTEDMDVKKVISTTSRPINKQSTCYFCLATCESVCCRACELDFIKEVNRCTICAKPSHTTKICGDCLISSPNFNNTVVLFDYQYPAKKLILAFKFKKHAELASYFANKFTDIILDKNNLPEALIPVPLHKKRQSQRGYNQSLQLAKCLGKKLNIPVNTDLCERIINTDPQSELPMKSRKKNVKNAFRLNNNNVPEHIAIVDDVITTGSTINEIAQLFKKAGCEQIYVWAIART